MRTRRRFGQHFLFDPRILGRIADALEAGPDDIVVEIGPGPGGLTAALAERTTHLVAIEKDRDLVPELRRRFPQATIIEGDALDFAWAELAGERARQDGTAGRWLVTGNIPYNVTSPLLERALTPPLPARVVFLVQKEVAERVTASPGTSAYGALSVGIQSAARAERLFTVPAGAFHPPPKVDSAVLRLTPLTDPVVPAGTPGFRKLVVGLFGLRRKQLVRGLRELTGRPAEWVEQRVQAAGLVPTARPETLTPAQFAGLLQCLVDGGWQPD